MQEFEVLEQYVFLMVLKQIGGTMSVDGREGILSVEL